MFKYLKNIKGDGSVVPIFLILSISLVSATIIFCKQLDTNLLRLQKARYTKAVDMSVNTAVSTIELSTEQDENLGTNLDKIALGYTLDNRLVVDKEKFSEVFYQVLFRNMQIVSGDRTREEAFKRYVPLKAIIQYDTIWLSAYDDDWQSYPMFFIDRATGHKIFLTLGSRYYTLRDVNQSWNLEANKNYCSIITPNSDNLPNTYGITEEFKQRMLAEIVEDSIESFVNAYKLNHKDYDITLGYFDRSGFSSAVKDVTFFCLVEGIPMKSFFSNEPDRSFHMFSFGGASLRRADQ